MQRMHARLKHVFSSGNLVTGLLHNFFMETGARLHKPMAKSRFVSLPTGDRTERFS